jgi:glucose-6-phosphate-specific signal transduction histidine kinase
MSMLLMGFLFVIATPFTLVVWVAYRHWPQSTPNAIAITEDCDGLETRGLTRARFAADTLSVEREVRAAIDTLDDLARANLARLDIAVRQESVVRVDPIVLRTVLHSLIGTAIRSAPTGQVLVTAMPLGSQMHVRVIDDGADTDQATREAMVREVAEIVALQGGSMVVHARPQRGTAVTLRLPSPGGTNAATADCGGVDHLAEQEA